MEKRIKAKVDDYFLKFKEDIKNCIVSKNDKCDISELQNELIKFVYAYEKLNLDKEDLQNAKELKILFLTMKDCAKRANNEQCTRRRKDGEMFCGTHIKGTPNGIFNSEHEKKPSKKVVEVTVQDIKGIVYYIDEENNVYNTEDVIANKENPRVIAKWVKDEADNYSIPEFDKVLET